jgi:long-subunit acyl-CoA synthetase (AMP-forming)
MECVPLYDTLGDSAIQYVVTHSEMRFIVADGSKLPGLAKALSGETGAALAGQLLGVAYWGKADEPARQASISLSAHESLSVNSTTECTESLSVNNTTECTESLSVDNTTECTESLSVNNTTECTLREHDDRPLNDTLCCDTMIHM